MIGGLGAMERFLIDMNAAIAARGGADSMYANDPGKLRACNKWVDHARPIIQAMFVLDDLAVEPMLAAQRTDETRLALWSKQSPLVRTMDEAKNEVYKASAALFAMLDGIRDNFIADERVGIGSTDDKTEAADEFNDWLGEHTITVDQAVQIVIDEQNAACEARRAA